uniref:Uncharacterized protein n=1 Tax=Heterorhabditis bacteriophora TaxID=37862 RepID=A0A1I7X8G6_HETBA
MKSVGESMAKFFASYSHMM